MNELVELLEKYNFDKQLKKLNKKLKDKKVILYGTGLFFQAIKSNYDLSSLNIIGVSDRKYSYQYDMNEDFDYRVYRIDELEQSGADYILVSTLNSFEIYRDFKKQYKKAKIKVMPLVKKTFFDLLDEIFD